MNNSIKKAILITITLCFLGNISFAQKVEISNPIPLSFGTVAVTGPGTITIAPNGTRTTNAPGNITFLNVQGHPAPSSALISIKVNQWSFGASYRLPSYIDLSNPNGATLRISSITHSTFPGGLFNILLVGNWEFEIGGTVSLSTNTSSGTYSGFFTVNLDYY